MKYRNQGQPSKTEQKKTKSSSYKFIENEMDGHRYNSKMKTQAKPGAELPFIAYVNDVLKNYTFCIKLLLPTENIALNKGNKIPVLIEFTFHFKRSRKQTINKFNI